MKIKVLINNIQDQTIINQGLILVKNSLSSINFPVEITVENINKVFTGTTFSNKAVGSGACVIPEQILNCVDGTDDVAFLIYDWNTVIPKPTNPCQSPIKKGNTTPCQMPIQWYMGFPDVFRDFFLHEICHAIYFLQNNVQNDITHNMHSFPEWTNKQPVDYYLWLLNNLKKNIPTQQSYKYFKPSEIVGLKPELVSLLDKARGIAGIPFIITSGYRTPEDNARVGGVQDSSHELGLAVDLLIKDSVSGGKILLALTQVGIKRFGFYADSHIHCDIDSTKPNPCYWIK